MTEEAEMQLRHRGDQPKRSPGHSGVTRVAVQPQLLEWSRARSGIDEATWTARFPRYDEWRVGVWTPTLKQLDDFARRTYTPIGYFFLEEPPDETLPISDFRTVGDRPMSEIVTADLLDTLYRCQARQEWYREHQLLNDESPLAFVGSAKIKTSPKQVANDMREHLGWKSESRKELGDRSTTLATLRESAEAIGVLVMISGIVGSNTHRKLDPAMFRGFALSNPYAALVFVNGADSKTAQIFTLAHELAHLWLGSSALSDINPESTRKFDVERWCNQVAAEFLVPKEQFVDAYDRLISVRGQLQSLANLFHVSTQVILGRMREIGVLTWEEFMAELDLEREQIAESLSKQGSGGSYYNTKLVQVSKRFAREVIASTLEGQTLYTEAFRLLDISNAAALRRLGDKLGVR